MSDELTIHLSPDLYARVLALGPDVKGFCLTAIEAALGQRTTMPPTPLPAESKPMGRPLKGDRLNVTVNLERRYLTALDAYATSLKVSRADAINSVLGKAIEAGILPATNDD